MTLTPRQRLRIQNRTNIGCSCLLVLAALIPVAAVLVLLHFIFKFW